MAHPEVCEFTRVILAGKFAAIKCGSFDEFSFSRLEKSFLEKAYEMISCLNQSPKFDQKMQTFTFNCPAFKEPVALESDLQTLHDIKPTILSILLQDSTTPELARILQFNFSVFNLQFKSNEIDILKSIHETLKRRLELHEIPEQSGQILELSSDQILLLANSIQFQIYGHTLCDDEEKNSLVLNNLDKNTTIGITFNFRLGFNSLRATQDEEDSSDRKEEDIEEIEEKKTPQFEIPEFFKCKTHKNTPITHFCKKCNKMICAFDIVNRKYKENGICSIFESCGGHIDHVITLEQYQEEVEVIINKEIEKLELINKEITEVNASLEQDAKDLIEKKERNINNFENNTKKIENIQKFFSIENKQPEIEINYSRLEIMAKFAFSEKEQIIIEENEIKKKEESYSAENTKFKKENEFLKTEIVKCTSSAEKMKEKFIKYEDKFSKMKELIAATSQAQKKLKDDEKKYFKVAIFSFAERSQMDDVERHFQKDSETGLEIQCPIAKNIKDPDAKSYIASQNWAEFDSIFFWSDGSASSNDSWFGDFLMKQLENGMGIVLCHGCTVKSKLFGNITSEIPFIPADGETENGPKELLKTIFNHPILNGVKKFDGGSGSYRGLIELVSAKEDEEIEVVGTWNDDSKTPMIITKSYSGEDKKNYGKIVVLNFWPLSNLLDKGFWDTKTDGHKIMQNAVTWPTQMQIQQESELETKLVAESWEKIKKILD